MKEYDVKITETLEKTVTVQAESHDAAEEQVRAAYYNSEYILDSENFTGVAFGTTEEREVQKEQADTMNVLLVKPFMYPQAVQIGCELEDLQKAVGGDIEATYPFNEPVALVMHDEGNPFAYIHSEKDILKLVTTLIANTKGDGKAGDEFWTKAETLLYCALIGYIHYEAPVEEQNFSTLIEFLNAMEVREDDEEFQNPVDLMFEALEKKKPNHFAVRQYKKYKLAAGKTAKSILISCGARLAPFDIQEVRDVTAYDELQLDTLGDKKTALFLIMSDTDATFNFLISMIYTQLFNLLCEKADDVYGGRLPVHVRCLIDEMANIGQIPNLEKLVATIRSREISACLVLQAQSQLKAIYKDNADTIIGNMDSRIFLGGSEPTTLKELNQALGKETIDTYNTSNTRGNSPSYGLNYQKLGKDLASVDELAVLDGSKCILQLRGVRPFLSDKYDLTQHPNYKYTSDFDKRNEFNIEQFLSRRLKLKAGDEFVVVDAD